MRNHISTVGLFCIAGIIVSLAYGDEAKSLEGVPAQLRENVTSIERMIEVAQQQLAVASELQTKLDQERNRKGDSDSMARADNKAAAAAEKEIVRLKKTLTALQKRLSELQDQVKSVETLQAELDKGKALCAESEAKAKSAGASRREAEERLASLRAKVSAAEKQVEQMDAQVRSGRRLESDLARAIKDRQEASARAEKEAGETQAAENKAALAKAELAGVEERYAETEKQVAAMAALRAELENEKKNLENYEAKAKAARSSRSSLEKQVSALKRELASVEKQLAGLQNELKKQEQDPIHAELEKTRKLRAEAETLEIKFTDARNETEKELADLKASLPAARKQVEEIEKQIRLGRRVESDLADEKKLREEALVRAEKQAKTVEAAEREMLRLKTEIAQLETQVSEGKKQIEAFGTLQAELEKEEKLREASETRVKSALVAQSLQEKELSRLKAKHASAQKELGRLQDRRKMLEQLQAELEKEKALKADCEAKANEQANGRIAVEKDLTRLNAELAVAEKKIEEMETLLKSTKNIESDLAREKKLKNAAKARGEEEMEAVKAVEKEIEGIKKKIAGVTEAHSGGAAKAEALLQLQNELAKQKKLREESEALIDSMRDQRGAKERQLSVLTRNLSAAEKNAAGIDGQIAEIESDLNEQRKINAEMQAKVEKQKEAEEAVAKETGVLEGKLKGLEKQYAEKTGRVALVNKMRDDLKKEQELEADAERQLDTAVRGWKDYEKKVACLKKDISRVERRLADLEGDLQPSEQLKIELDKVKKARVETAVKVEAETKKQSTIDSELAALGEKTLSLEGRIKEIGKQVSVSKPVSQKEDDKRRLQEAAEALKAEVEARGAVEKDLKAAETSIADLKSQLSSAEKSRKTFKKEIDKARRASSEDYAKKEADLWKRIQGLDEQLRASKQQNDKLTEQLEQQSEQIAGRKAAAVTGEESVDILVVEEQIVAEARSETGASKTGVADTQSRGVTDETEPPVSVTSASLSKANACYQRGVKKWDRGDIDGAIEEFEKTITLNPEAAGAFYNLGLAYLRKDDQQKACDYAYKAGRCYLRNGNKKQTLRMVMFLKTIDSSSPLIEELQTAISKETP